MVEVDDRDLYQLLISEFRYSVKRDNHLAPGTCAVLAAQYLPKMSKNWRAHTAQQLTNEIITERIFGCGGAGIALKQDSEWEKLLVFLTNYLEALPLNTERYMSHLYHKPGYTADIDYYSVEMSEKVKNNQMKK